jgi:tetratricopeptide (TPR) repeat protein
LEIANHYLRGENREKAREYYIKAAKRATDLYAHAEAYSRYQSALELLEDASTTENRESMLLRAELLKNMGDEAQFLPQYEKTFECWKRSVELYERCGERLKAAGVLVKLGMAYHIVMYELEESEAALQKAVELAKQDSATPSAELARLNAYAVTSDIWRSDRERVKEKSALALKLAEESGAYDVIAMVSSYGIGADYVREIDESIASCNRGLRVAHEHGLLFEASYNYFHRACAYTYTYGPSRTSLDFFLEGLNFTESRGNFMVNLFHKVELVYGVYLPLGEWKKAREMAEESLVSVQRFPVGSLFRLIAESAMGQVLLHQGDLTKAEGFLEHVRQATNGFGVLQLDVPLYIALAQLNMAKENFQNARIYLNEGYRLSKQRGLTVINGIPHIQILSLMIEFHLGMAESGRGLLLDTKEEEVLDNLLSDLRNSAKEIGKEWPLAYLNRSEGLIAGQRRDFDSAIGLLERSAALFKNLGWPYELARTQYQLGRMHFRKGNVLSSIRLLEAASEIFSTLGANRDLERIASLTRRIDDQGTPLIDEHPVFQNEESEIVFESLKTEFMNDILFKKLDASQCGWRSLNEILRGLKLSKYALYGRSEGGKGPVLKELISLGSIETRTFSGERGRGGEIMKVRVSYGTSRSHIRPRKP